MGVFREVQSAQTINRMEKKWKKKTHKDLYVSFTSNWRNKTFYYISCSGEMRTFLSQAWEADYTIQIRPIIQPIIKSNHSMELRDKTNILSTILRWPSTVLLRHICRCWFLYGVSLITPVIINKANKNKFLLRYEVKNSTLPTIK